LATQQSTFEKKFARMVELVVAQNLVPDFPLRFGKVARWWWWEGDRLIGGQIGLKRNHLPLQSAFSSTL
jgi:hypothetical protein